MIFGPCPYHPARCVALRELSVTTAGLGRMRAATLEAMFQRLEPAARVRRTLVHKYEVRLSTYYHDFTPLKD